MKKTLSLPNEISNIEEREIEHDLMKVKRVWIAFQDENLISFIKGGLKVRHAYNLYRLDITFIICLLALAQQMFFVYYSSQVL